MRHATITDRAGKPITAVPGLDADLPGLRAVFARDRPGPITAYGPCGAKLRLHASSGVCNGSIIVSQAEHGGAEWIHASIARENHMPTYADLATLKRGVFGPARWAFQVFPAQSRHVNIHAHALHIWGRADGRNPLPDFGACPNDPPCPHSGVIHDIYAPDDLHPMCCADGCPCGKDPQ